MKFIRIILPVLMLLASMAEAQQSQVTLTLPSGTLNLIRNDYDGSDSALSLSNLVGGQVPLGSQFIGFDASRQAYLPTVTRDRTGSWGPAGTTVLARGQAYWLRIPPVGAFVASNQYQVTFSGAVPTSSFTVTSSPRGNAVGYPYPILQTWTNTQYSRTCPNGSILYVWSATGGIFTSWVRSFMGWGPGTPSLLPGQGYFVFRNNANPTNFVEPKPY